MGYRKIDPDFKAKWVQALRSGRYWQTRSQLARVENKRYRYCCLGVACQITPEAKRLRYDDGLNYVAFEVDGIRADTHLPSPLAKAIGLSAIAESRLIDMNDTGRSFSEIADWIEANL